jgi:TonB family protein
MRRLFLALSLLLFATAPAIAEHTVWLDVALDEQGQVTETFVVGELHPALLGPVNDWVRTKRFSGATVEGRPVPSTTSVWITYILEDVEDGYELRFLNYDSAPRPTRETEPTYPRSALQSGQEGWVKVGFKILPTGRVSDIEVLESSHRIFEPPAIRAVKQWRFHPATVDGKAVGDEVVRTIEFKVE